MHSILLFAGTTEGRRIANALLEQPLDVTVSVATEYGETLIEPGENLRVIFGRKNAAEIEALIKETGAELLIDATHPYAVEVTKTLRAVCAETGTDYLRVLRDSEKADGCVFVEDADAAVEYLNKTQGNVLLTVGSKELSRYTAVRGFETRLYARILPVKESTDAAFALGFSGAHLICMQGPFSEELNAALLKSIDASYLVTKDTGAAGGFAEKIRAARACGATPVVIQRPSEEQGVSEADCIRLLEKRFHLVRQKEITILGVGTGSGQLTEAAIDACRRAELIVGAPRVTDVLAGFSKRTVHAILPDEIESLIRNDPAQRIVVAMSGDTGFFSGTKGLLSRIGDLRPNVLPGVSSLAYFSARIGVSWDDAAHISAHGRACNLMGTVRQNAKTTVLTAGESGVSDLLHTLCEYGLSDVRVTVGENLSYPNEAITSGTAKDLLDRSFAPLSIVLIENDAPKIVTHGRPDPDFLRTDVPMTKSEVRAVTLSKLKLTQDAVCWDVGAGTGSVAIEMAECAVRGAVYAIERDEPACELIEQNKRRLGVTNLTVVHGTAPKALSDLPKPTHVFIGGSGGKLSEIVRCALGKNPRARIVLNTVTAETFAEALAVLKAFPLENEEITELAVSRGRKVGGYHLMTAQNPVYIISCEGAREDA